MIETLAMMGSGVISVDPTPYIAVAWGLSALTIGGLTAHAIWRFTQTGKK
ncbi:MAG: hypothetical protein ACWA5T_02450 [Parvularcula sp.]